MQSHYRRLNNKTNRAAVVVRQPYIKFTEDIMLAFFAIIIGIIFLDQLTKWLAVIFLKGNASAVIIEDIFRFTYLENKGRCNFKNTFRRRCI